MWIPRNIEPGETDSERKKVLFEVFTSDGLLASGGADPNYEAAAPSYAVGDLKVSYDLGASWTNVTGTPAMQGKAMKYVFDNAEVATSHLPAIAIGLKFSKTNFRDQEFYIPFESEGTLLSGSSSGATFYKTFSTRVITTGTEVGTLANTTGLDQSYHDLVPAAGSLDAYYEADLSSVPGAYASLIDWYGYNDDAPAGGTMIVELYNWNTTSWDQVGTIVDSVGVEIHQQFTATLDHTSNTKIVRWRVRSGPGSSSARLRNDRVLVGCGVVVTAASLGIVNANVKEWQDDPVNILVDGNVPTSVQEWLGDVPATLDLSGYVKVNAKVIGTNVIDFDVFTPRCFLTLARTPVVGELSIDGGQPISGTAFRLPAGLLAFGEIVGALIMVTLNTAAGCAAIIDTYDNSTGDTTLKGNGLMVTPDATSGVRLFVREQPNLTAIDAKLVDASDDMISLIGHGAYHGGVTAYTTDTLTIASTDTPADGSLVDDLLYVYKGAGKGITRRIVGNTGKLINLEPGGWVTALELIGVEGTTRVVTLAFGFSDLGDLPTTGDLAAATATIIAAIPTAAQIRDAILDALLQDHSIVGSVADGIAIAAGLLQGNFFIDQVDNTNPNGQTSARMRVFRSAAAMASITDGGVGEGEFATFLVTTTYVGPNKIATHKVVRQ